MGLAKKIMALVVALSVGCFSAFAIDPEGVDISKIDDMCLRGDFEEIVNDEDISELLMEYAGDSCELIDFVQISESDVDDTIEDACEYIEKAISKTAKKNNVFMTIAIVSADEYTCEVGGLFVLSHFNNKNDILHAVYGFTLYVE